MTLQAFALVIGCLGLALGVAVFLYNHRRNRASVAVVARCAMRPGCLEVELIVTKHGMTPIQIHSVGLAWLEHRWVLGRHWPPVHRAGVTTCVSHALEDDQPEVVLAFDGQILRRVVPTATYRKEAAQFGRLPDKSYAAGPTRVFYGPISADLARCLLGDCD